VFPLLLLSPTRRQCATEKKKHVGYRLFQNKYLPQRAIFFIRVNYIDDLNLNLGYFLNCNQRSESRDYIKKTGLTPSNLGYIVRKFIVEKSGSILPYSNDQHGLYACFMDARTLRKHYKWTSHYHCFYNSCNIDNLCHVHVCHIRLRFGACAWQVILPFAMHLLNKTMPYSVVQ
jgi:hypothetical protein